MKKKILFAIIFLLSFVSLSSSVYAQNTSSVKACGIFPCTQYGGVFNLDADVNGQIGNIIRLVLILVFFVLIMWGIFLIIKAAISIIRSEGDATKLEEGTKAIKGVFIAIGLILVGIFGILIVILIFNAGGIVDVNIGNKVPENFHLPIITN